jgi:DNA-binding CsgD family transcriptional regulator
MMVGREGEQAQLSDLVTSAGGRCLVIRGETGAGKSALLDYTADLAEQSGLLVIRTTGVEAESELTYAGLHQLLSPLLPEVARLEEDRRALFDTLFSPTADGSPSVMALGIAVLDLLSLIAAERPLLLVVDDGQWLDSASADIFGFVGRRLSGRPVKMLVAIRADVPSRFDTAALPEATVGALVNEDAALLLDRHHPTLSRHARQVVLDQARGNPLALLELPAHLPGQPGAHIPEDAFDRPGAPLPLRLQHLYGTRIAALTAPVRAELLMSALDEGGARPDDGGTRTRYRMRDADEAVACGLLDIDPVSGDFVFRHPLVGASVVRMATPDQRRAAHQELAWTHREDLERRAVHLAAATVDPDGDVAEVLEAAADKATRRSAAVEAVSWLTRAAELSENQADRSRRLGDAALVAGCTGRPDQRVVAREVETGAVLSGMAMLNLIMLDQMAAGEWAAAERTGERALILEAEHGNELFAHQTRGQLAQLAALRGQVEPARRLRAAVDSWARPRGIGFLTQLADAAGLAAALSAGDYETAYHHAVAITPPGTFQPYAFQASRTLLDLVEAALHTGRSDEARRHALAARDAGLADLTPRLALITYGALAMTAGGEKEATDLYERAEFHPAAARFPFELARIRLAHGTRARHARNRIEARQLLVSAAESFERLGATGWAERARAELRTAGASPRLSTLSLSSLSWQERRIADLAASGLTNKEIGNRMCLSPRTVSSHLYRVFPKLGITTRAALRDALSRTEEITTAV